MSLCLITGIVVQNNPSPVSAPFSFDIRFECLKNLEGVFDWKVIYVGSANDPSYDQIIESFEMDNLSTGVMQFQIQAPPPDFSKIPQEEIVGKLLVI